MTEEGWKTREMRMFGQCCFNLFVLQPIGFYTLIGFDRTSILYKYDEIPSFGMFLIHFFWMFMMEDFAFYWTHRLLHHPKLYPYIHKVHHESKSTTSLSAIATHPVEYFLGNSLASSFGMITLPGKVHIVSVACFIMFRVFETIEGHSGYEFPFGTHKFIPMATNSNYHNYHHLINIGNYGSLMVFWDSIFNTNTEYFKQVETINETREIGTRRKIKKD